MTPHKSPPAEIRSPYLEASWGQIPVVLYVFSGVLEKVQAESESPYLEASWSQIPVVSYGFFVVLGVICCFPWRVQTTTGIWPQEASK